MLHLLDIGTRLVNRIALIGQHTEYGSNNDNSEMRGCETSSPPALQRWLRYDPT